MTVMPSVLLLSILVAWSESFLLSPSPTLFARQAERLPSSHLSPWRCTENRKFDDTWPMTATDDVNDTIELEVEEGDTEGIDQLRLSVMEESERARQAEQRVESLQKQVAEYQRKIDSKELSLRQVEEAWKLEKRDLQFKISDFTSLLQRKDKDNQMATQALEQRLQSRQTQLENELQQLRVALQQSQESLGKEREAADAVKSRLMETEDQLEFEQMRYKKEKAELGDRVNAEKSRLNQVELQFKEETQRFKQEKSSFQKKIQEESEKLAEVEAQLVADRKQFQEDCASLNVRISEEKSKFSDAMRQLNADTERFTAKRKQLEDVVADQKSKLEASENLLQKRTQKFESNQQDLEMKIIFERTKVDKLTKELAEEQQRFERERVDLEDKLDNERTRLSKVEATLKGELARFDKEKKDLEYAISEGLRIRRLKASQMSERYTAIRNELTERLEATKRNARKEERRLAQKYEGKLAQVNDAINELKENLAVARQSSVDLSNRLSDMTRQRDLVKRDKESLEKSYIQTIEKRNIDIAFLKNDVSALQKKAKEKDEKIARYEGSFRELLKLSFKLMRNRLRYSREKLRKSIKARSQ